MDHPYCRTFIGLPLQVSRQFLQARKELMEMLEGERINWVDPSRYHITLRFIGDTGISMIPEISRSLKQVVQVPVKQYLSLDTLGSFGHPKKPRVLWIGFEDARSLEGLREMTDLALERCGIPADEKPFSPHLTLGRIKNRVRQPAFQAAVESMKKRFSEKILLDRMVFFRSETGREGPVYTPLSRLDFKDQDF